MPDCPSCEETLDTDKGVKLHHYYKHGESISLEQSECIECGEVFKFYPSDKEGYYCKDCAKEQPWEWSFDDPGGKDSPNYRKDSGKRKVSTNCSNCGENLEVTKYRKQRRKNVFCDVECVSEYRRNNWQGENHPLWKGGEIESYGHGWSSIRSSARERDGHKCKVCGKPRNEIGYGPEVHHIKPVREFNNIENAHKLSNVISLCPKCHANAEHGNIPREDLYQKI